MYNKVCIYYNKMLNTCSGISGFGDFTVELALIMSKAIRIASDACSGSLSGIPAPIIYASPMVSIYGCGDFDGDFIWHYKYNREIIK